jgi:hypothetical protein
LAAALNFNLGKQIAQQLRKVTNLLAQETRNRERMGFDTPELNPSPMRPYHKAGGMQFTYGFCILYLTFLFVCYYFVCS